MGGPANNALRGVSLQRQALVIGYGFVQMTRGDSFVEFIIFYLVEDGYLIMKNKNK